MLDGGMVGWQAGWMVDGRMLDVGGRMAGKLDA